MTISQAEDHGPDSLHDQHRLVLAQKYFVLKSVDADSRHLDSKAMALLQSAGIIIVLTGVLTIPSSFIGASPSGWAKAGIAVSFLAFILMILCAILAWYPQHDIAPGSLDWDDMYDGIILKGIDEAYAQVLIDTVNAIEVNLARNERKARLIRLSAVLLAVQIAGLLIVALMA